MEEKSKEQIRIDEFINWYDNEATYYSTSEIGQFYPKIDMCHLIDKIAMWYELKFCPDKIGNTNNMEIYNNELLLASLPWYERIYFLKTRYINYVKVGGKSTFNINLDDDGIIYDGGDNRHLIDKGIIGMHIKEAYNYLSENEEYNTEMIRRALANYEIQESIKRLLYESIVYRILDKKNDNHRLRRAFTFIKDFSLNPSILIQYAKEEKENMLLEEIESYLESPQDIVLKKING